MVVVVVVLVVIGCRGWGLSLTPLQNHVRASGLVPGTLLHHLHALFHPPHRTSQAKPSLIIIIIITTITTTTTLIHFTTIMHCLRCIDTISAIGADKHPWH
jgi:hypothetical protein